MNPRIIDAIGKTVRSLAASVFFTVTLVSLPVWAQTTSPAPQPAAPPPATMPDSPRTVPEKIAPPTPSVVGSASTPSVVVPKPMDPGIQVPVKTPTNDKMPVIKPPPAPDANTTVAPK